MNSNSNKPLFYPYSIIVNKCRGSCNNVHHPYAKLCVPDLVKDMYIKVFNLMSKFKEARYVSSHETCTYKCRLDTSVSNNKHRLNNDKCRLSSKELIENGKCDDGYICNLSIRKCKCDKS